MNTEPDIALWVITRGGLRLARRLQEHLHQTTLFVSESVADDRSVPHRFNRLSDEVARQFNRFDGHVFFTSTGIAVRMVAGYLQHKTIDPAVVVVDDTGRFAVSLLSGHLGGANALARRVSDVIGGIPVITTATDANQLPSIDMIAKEQDLVIENPEAIKTINKAFLENRKIRLSDPYGLIGMQISDFVETQDSNASGAPAVVVDDRVHEASSHSEVLYLRPKTLCVGIGCNRGTPFSEIRDFLQAVCAAKRLALASIHCMGTIDIKKDEAGIVYLGKALKIPIRFFDKDTLNQVDGIQNPSAYAKEYTGAQSVCEAAAILGAQNGELIVPKQKTPNVTISIARERTFCM